MMKDVFNNLKKPHTPALQQLTILQCKTCNAIMNTMAPLFRKCQTNIPNSLDHFSYTCPNLSEIKIVFFFTKADVFIPWSIYFFRQIHQLRWWVANVQVQQERGVSVNFDIHLCSKWKMLSRPTLCRSVWSIHPGCVADPNVACIPVQGHCEGRG